MAETYKRATSRYPGLVREVNPEILTADGTAEPYDIYPGFAGIAQLLMQEALVLRPDKSFQIAKPFKTFPTTGATYSSYSFFLPDTIPVPENLWFLSSIYSAETGACLAGRCKP